MNNLTLSLFFAFTAAFSLTACSAGPKPGNGFVQAAVKKGGSGVDVAYRVEGTAQPNVPVTITVQFSGVNSPDGARASFAAEAPAALSGAPALTLAPGQAHSTSVRVTAPADGTYFVNVTTSQAGRSSVISIPVVVGAGGVRLQKQGTEKTAPGGEKVISLPSK